MKLIVSSQGILYCTFEEKDLRTYYSMSFEEFQKDRDAIKRFADVIVKKAVKTGKIQAEEGEKYNVSLYDSEEGKYFICMQKESVL